MNGRELDEVSLSESTSMLTPTSTTQAHLEPPHR